MNLKFHQKARPIITHFYQRIEESLEKVKKKVASLFHHLNFSWISESFLKARESHALAIERLRSPVRRLALFFSPPARRARGQILSPMPSLTRASAERFASFSRPSSAQLACTSWCAARSPRTVGFDRRTPLGRRARAQGSSVAKIVAKTLGLRFFSLFFQSMRNKRESICLYWN